MKAKLFRIAATVLALTLAVSMAACGTAKKTTKKTSSKESVSSKQIESVEETPSEEESSSEESSSEESSSQQPSSQTPAASSQTPSQAQPQTKPGTHAYTDAYGWTWEIPDDQEPKKGVKYVTVRFPKPTDAEFELIRQGVIEELIWEMNIHFNTTVQATSDLNALADAINDKATELITYANANGMTAEQYQSLALSAIDELQKPYRDTYTCLSGTTFTDPWNDKEHTYYEGDYRGQYNAFDDFITGKGGVNFLNLGHLYGCWLWYDGYHANQPWFTDDIRYIGVSVRLMDDGYMAVYVSVADNKR